MIKSGEQDLEVKMDLTPIIDMVFLLLIFFLVATTFHQTEREMQVALPAASSAGPITTSLRELIINVNEAGEVIISGQTVEPEDLAVLIEQAVQNNPDQKITVRGDQNTAYANIVRVLDICKTNGIQEPYLDTVLVGRPRPGS